MYAKSSNEPLTANVYAVRGVADQLKIWNEMRPFGVTEEKSDGLHSLFLSITQEKSTSTIICPITEGQE